jgi:hypothetical protein
MSDLVTPLIRATGPILAPLDHTLRPVTDALLSTVSPVTTVLDSVLRPFAGLISQAVTTLSAPVHRTMSVTPAETSVAATEPAGTGTGVAAPHTGADPVGTDQSPAAYSPAGIAGTARVWPAYGTRSGGSLPGRPMPAPLTGVLGLGTGGSSTSGSGSPQHGGGYAVVPAQVVASSVAVHRLPKSTDFGVTRRYAENPTVSPD